LDVKEAARLVSFQRRFREARRRPQTHYDLLCCCGPCCYCTQGLLDERDEWLSKYTAAFDKRLPDLREQYCGENGEGIGGAKGLAVIHAHLASCLLDGLGFGLGVSQLLGTIFWILFTPQGQEACGGVEVSIANAQAFVYEVVRLYAPPELAIFGYLEPYKRNGHRTFLHLGAASQDPKVWGDDAHLFKLRPIAQYEELSVAFAEGCDAGHGVSPYNRSCPAKELTLTLLTEFVKHFVKLTMYSDEEETVFEGTAWVPFDTEMEQLGHDAHGLHDEMTLLFFGDCM